MRRVEVELNSFLAGARARVMDVQTDFDELSRGNFLRHHD